MKPTEAPSPVDALVGCLAPRPRVRLVYLFGSGAAGALRSGSDLDVAVLFTVRPEPATLDDLVVDLEAATGRPVDLVDLARASPLLAHEVIARGRLILCRDDAERVDFETRTIARYVDTAHLRRVQESYLAERAKAFRARSG